MLSIASTGTQRIDTGVVYNSANEYVMEAVCKCSGAGYSGWNAGGMFGYASGKWGHGNGSGSLSSTVLSTVKMTINAGTSTTTTIEITQGESTETISRAHGSLASYATVSFPIFAYTNNSGGYQGYANFEVQNYRISVNGDVVRDYRPCYDPDGVACLYDEVSKEYYYNTGTGEFEATPLPETGGNTWAYLSDGTFLVPYTGRYEIEMHGGGGGGGYGSVSDYLYTGGGGGGSGELYTVTLEAGTSIPITIGAGGKDCGDGGTTTFGDLSLAGGAGGNWGTNNTGGAASGSLATAGGAGIKTTASSGAGGAGGYGNINKPSLTYGNGGRGGTSQATNSEEDGYDGAVLITYLGT